MSIKYCMSIALFWLLSTSTAFCANRFWRSGTVSNWNNTANWSTTSGGLGGASVPGAGDVAIFDGGGLGGSIIDINVSVQGFQILVGYTGTVIQQAGFTVTIGTGGFSQANGIFSGNNGAIDINSGTFVLSGGAFVSTTGTLFVGGTFANNVTVFDFTGGTFLHNSGTVRFDPDFNACAQRTATANFTSVTTFNNLVIDVTNLSCTEDIFVVTGSTPIVSGSLTHFDGFFNSGSIELTGNLFVDTSADGGVGTILINGTGAQQFNYTGTGRTSHLRVNKASGTLAAAGGTTTLRAQQFTLDAGTVTAPTGEFRVGGDWTGNPTVFAYNAGTFTHNNGTVRIDPIFGECAQRTATISAAGAISFFNLIADVDNTSCTEDILAVSGAGSIVVLNDLTQFDGYINTGTIQVRANLYLDVNADGGTATILLNGTGAQTYNNSSTARFAHLRVNKTTGAVSPGVGTTNFRVQQFTLDAGTFNAPTGDFRIGGDWTGNPTIFTIAAGTFNHNNGTVRLDPVFGECAQRTATLSAAAAVTFFNLIIDADNTSCTEDILAVSGAGTIVVTNDFTAFDGYVNAGTVEVRGNIYLDAGADGGTATILLNGTGAQTYNNTSTARFAHLRVNKASGAVSAGVGTTTFRVQQFTLDAGTFNAPTGEFRVGGDWTGNPTIFTLTGGTFNHNNGTVRFDPVFGECAQRTATLSTPSVVTFYNLILDVDNTSCTEDIFAVSGASSVIVDNDFTQFDGYVNTGTVEVHGNVYLDTNADGGTATILLNSTGTQTYNNTSTARFAHLRVNKSAGVVNPGVGTTNFRVQQFTLDAGTFNAPTGEFRVGGDWVGNPTLFAVTGGTFNHNNGTVRIDPVFGECAQRTATLSTPTAVSFFNLILDTDNTSCTEDIFAVSGASSVIVLNDFTLFDGYVNTGTVEVRGNVYLDTNADGGTATILMNGTGTQTYNNTSTARFAHLRVNKTTGVVNPGVGTTNFRVQQFTLDAGTFNAPTGEFRVGGDWVGNPTLFTLTGGTFNHNNGTVRIDPVFGECAQRTATLSTPSVATFFNLILDTDNTSCTEDIFAVSGASSVIVLNDFTLFDGYVNTGTVEVRGNVYLDVNADGGTATILMNGTGTQTYNNASTARFAHLRVNKISGVVNPGAGTTSFRVQQFTLDAGTFNAPTGEFRVGGDWTGNPTVFAVNGGTFNHNNGTVRIDPIFGECAQRTATLSTPSPVTFFNLIIDTDNTSCTEDIFSVSGASTAIVDNDFTQFDGYVNTGTIEVHGNVYLDVGADGGTATILMNGTGTQTYNNASTARFAHLRVNKASGVVNPGVGTTDFRVQRFTLDAGVFNAPTGNFQVGGDWTGNPTIFTYTSGTFNHNNGTVQLDPIFGECAQRTATMSNAGVVTFYNLVINVDNTSCTEDIFNVAGTTSITVQNNLTLFDGFINSAAITVLGNVVASPGLDGATSSLIFSGSNAQTFDLTGVIGNINGNITLNKSANQVTLLSPLLMDAASQNLILTSGQLVSTTTNLLTIGDNVVVSGASASSFVNGPITKVGNDAFTFPTGKSNIYSPIRITAPGVITDAFNAEYFAANATGAGYNISTRVAPLTDVSSCDYWILDRTAGGSSVTVTLTWNRAAGCYGLTYVGDLAVARWNGTQWVTAGRTAAAITSPTTGTVTSSLVSSFSPFAVASTASPLPVDLLSFKAHWENRLVSLDWITTSELNNDRFEIERSSDLKDFQSIGQMDGAGNSVERKSYTYVDEKPLPGISYYRLKQVDFDGNFEYSDVISVTNEWNNPGFVIYPNPVAPRDQFVHFSESVSVQVYNALNQLVLYHDEATDKLDVSSLNSGVYVLRNNKGEITRLVVE